MDFTIIDGVAAAVVIVSAILAYARGFVRELLSIAGWVAAAVVAFIFAPKAVPLTREIPYLNTMLESCEPATITAFALVFALALVVVSIFTPIFAGAVQRSFLGGLDQGLGFLFGVARGILLVIVAFVIYDRVTGDQRIEMVDKSKTADLVAQMSAPIDDAIPTDAPGWIVGTYEDLVASCDLPAADTDASTDS